MTQIKQVMFAALSPIKKYHSLSDVSATASHNTRKSHPKNARLVNGKSIAPTVFLGPNTSKEISMETYRRTKALITRKDNVRVIGHVFSASRSFFPKNWTEDHIEVQNWVKQTLNAVHEIHGENLLSVIGHFDETTPHIHVLSVPLVAGRLCAKQYTSRLNLINWQSIYAKHVDPLGLRRGISSKVTRTANETLSDFYKTIDSELFDEPAPPILKKLPQRPRLSWRQPEERMIEHERICKQINEKNKVDMDIYHSKMNSRKKIVEALGAVNNQKNVFTFGI